MVVDMELFKTVHSDNGKGSAPSATHGKAPNLLENSFFIVKYVVV